jgi:WD40 repeat protein
MAGHGGDGRAAFVPVARFSPDGRWILSASWDGTARLWPTDPEALLGFVPHRSFTEEEAELYRPLLEGS